MNCVLAATGTATATTTTRRFTTSRTLSYISGLMSKRLLVSILASSMLLALVVTASQRSDAPTKLQQFRELERP